MPDKKVLIISTVGLNFEGITTVIYNYASFMNKTGIKLDFIGYKDINLGLKKQFERIGQICFTSERKKNIRKYIYELNDILKNGYDVVHIHGNSGTMLLEVVLAKFNHINNIIIHCHNTKCSHQVINNILKLPMKKLADNLLACSKAAGDWLYGNSRYVVLNNAIDIQKNNFNWSERIKYRKEFGFSDEFVIGHSGHFSEQKNHSFLIDVFAEFHKKEPCSKLLLLSDGIKFQEIRDKVQNLNLQDAVVFAGRRSDMSQIYNVMDIFLLPSLWEGLPMVMLEAQANGLPVLVSNCITLEAKCTDRVFYKKLSEGAACWADAVIEIKNMNFVRTDDMNTSLLSKGFDINIEAEMLRKIYLQ